LGIHLRKAHGIAPTESNRERLSRWNAAHPGRMKEIRRRHYLANKAEYKERAREWKAVNPEKAKASAKRHRQTHREALSARHRRWYATHPEQKRIEGRRRFAKRRDEILLRQKEAYRADPKLRARIKAQGRDRRNANRDKANATRRRWYHRNLDSQREKARIQSQQRRAIKRAASGRASAKQIRARVAFYGWRCWMCREPWQHLDHVIPLIAGGSHWPANLRPACARCNLKKGGKKPSMGKA